MQKIFSARAAISGVRLRDAWAKGGNPNRASAPPASAVIGAPGFAVSPALTALIPADVRLLRGIPRRRAISALQIASASGDRLVLPLQTKTKSRCAGDNRCVAPSS